MKLASAKTNYIVIAVFFTAVTVMYWVAADPPSPRIFAISGAGVLFCIGVTIYKKRKGLLS